MPGKLWILAAKAYATLVGRDTVQRSDIDRIAAPVLRHRIQLATYEAAAMGKSTDSIIQELLAQAQTLPVTWNQTRPSLVN